MQILPFVFMGAGWLVFDWAVNKGLVKFTGKDVNQNLDNGLAKVIYLVKDNTKEPTDTESSNEP